MGGRKEVDQVTMGAESEAAIPVAAAVGAAVMEVA